MRRKGCGVVDRKEEGRWWWKGCGEAEKDGRTRGWCGKKEDLQNLWLLKIFSSTTFAMKSVGGM